MMAMKYALLILLVLLVWWLLRPRVRRPPGPSRGPRAPQTMVHCAHCGVHLPQADALAWRGSYYCDETHRVAAEQHDG